MTYKVCTVVGTRPEIIKLSPVLRLLDKYADHTLVHTGQHYDDSLSSVFFQDLDLKEPKHYLHAKGGTAVGTVAQSMVEFDKLLESSAFDCVLVYGDTNSCLCTYSAKRRQIPIFHMEAGNRCFDSRVPEEVNRKIIDHLADVNMVISEHARQNLLREGLLPEYIVKVGSTVPQALRHLDDKHSSIRESLNLESGEYFLVSIHREENIDNPTYLSVFVDVLAQLSSQKKVVVSTHPKTRMLLGKYASRLEGAIRSGSLHLHDPFGIIDYIDLQKNAYCTVSDSGTIWEESSILNAPAITIRDSSERPEGLEEGVLIISHWDVQHILKSIEICVDTYTTRQRVKDYAEADTAQKVIKVIFGMLENIRQKRYFNAHMCRTSERP